MKLVNNDVANGLTYRGNTVWHEGNQGAGTGLDADTLDGLQATDFLLVNGKAVDSALADYATNSGQLDGLDSTDFLRVNGKAVTAGRADSAFQADNADKLDGFHHDSFLKIAGGTLSGYLTLHASPTQINHAATKGYVDAIFAQSDIYWAGATTLANVQSTYSSFPTGTKVAFWNERVYNAPRNGNGGNATVYDRYKQTVQKQSNGSWLTIGD